MFNFIFNDDPQLHHCELQKCLFQWTANLPLGKSSQSRVGQHVVFRAVLGGEQVVLFAFFSIVTIVYVSLNPCQQYEPSFGQGALLEACRAWEASSSRPGRTFGGVPGLGRDSSETWLVMGDGHGEQDLRAH